MLHISSADLSHTSPVALREDIASRVGAPVFAIVSETLDHIAVREALLDRAMGPGRTRKSSEAIRRGRRPAEGLAFSAVSAGGALLGTLRLWHVASTAKTGGTVSALLLGPLAIDPAAQGLGLGAAMMRHAVDAAAALGHGAIILVGDPDYYVRFGFSAALTQDLAMPGPFEPRRLLALELIPGSLDEACGILHGSGPKIRVGSHRRPKIRRQGDIAA